jgi:LacI family transcriptional regulator
MRKADPSPTQKDLAKALGMAQSTVSMALRGDASITRPTRERVLKVATAMGYQPNPSGAALAHLRQSSKVRPVQASLAWLNAWPEPGQLRRYREFDCYWEGASRAALAAGYRLDEFVVNEDLPLRKLGKILQARNVNGIIVPPGPLPAGWEDFDWSDYSLVQLRIPRLSRDLAAFSVSSDQAGNAMLATQVMRSKGYRRVGFVGIKCQTRMFGAGYLWGQQELSPAERLKPLLLREGEGLEIQLRVLGRWMADQCPDAILTDIPGVPDMLARLGFRVPEDVGLAALGTLDCPIDSGIHQNPAEVGRVGVQMLVSLINSNVRGLLTIRQDMLVKGTWTDGASLPQRRVRPRFAEVAVV